MDDSEDEAEGAVVVPIGEEIDLHSFAPRDVPAVVADYLAACREKGLRLVRLVHGRGKGVQRAVVRRLLADLEAVEAFADAPPAAGGWGATVVRLRPTAPTVPAPPGPAPARRPPGQPAAPRRRRKPPS